MDYLDNSFVTPKSLHKWIKKLFFIFNNSNTMEDVEILDTWTCALVVCESFELQLIYVEE